MPTIAIIGSGFSGLSAAAYLSNQGYEVVVYEKNSTPGGRARTFQTDNGYLFDMGPSWYWMPGVFEQFFQNFGYKVSDLYDLQLLDPAFEVVYGRCKNLTIPASYSALKELFDEVEPGSSTRLDAFMKEAAYKYKIGMERLVYMPGISIKEFADLELFRNIWRLEVFSSFSNHVAKHFTEPRLKALMEFPVLFLGAMPGDTPSLYSLMNYAGLKLGTWYPLGGFGKVIEAMMKVNREQGVKFHFNAPIEKILVEHDRAVGVITNGEVYNYDAVIASADYHHVESDLLETQQKNYPEDYWQKKTFAPSCLIFYIGMRKKIDVLQHHTLFFEEDLTEHSIEIYKKPGWPSKPLFYTCCPSKTDSSVAPPGHENLFILMPIAPGLHDDEETREKYFDIIIQRIEKHTGETGLKQYIDFKRSYCVSDFISDYNSYKGNAYGLANTLRQTAILKPKIRNKKIKNLFYAGQLTVPGPGVPPSLISGKLAAEQLHKYFKKQKNEIIV